MADEVKLLIDALRSQEHRQPINPKAVYRTRDVALFEDAADMIERLVARSEPSTPPEGWREKVADKVILHPEAVLSACEAEADVWAAAVDLSAMIKRMMPQSWAPMEEKFESFVHLAFVEGAYRGAMNVIEGKTLQASIEAGADAIASISVQDRRGSVGEEWSFDLDAAPKGSPDTWPPSVLLCWTDKEGSRFVGEAAWHSAERGAGDWWWAGTSPNDYHADTIVNSITGQIIAWRPMPQAPAPTEPKDLPPSQGEPES